MALIGRAILKLGADVTEIVSATNKANKHLKKLSYRARKAGDSLAGLKALAMGYLSALGIEKLGDLGSEILNTSSKFEQLENRMSAFTTSAQQSNAEMARARQFAISYNQDISKTTEALIMMKNYGLNDSTEALKTYINTAIGGGKSIDQFAEAMVDAITGENERLKEFGVKASLLGNKIGYQWVDSSGKTRNVIIKNNKDIIDSTLRTIFNEKYVGQLEKYKNSWLGTKQSIANSYVAFNNAVMDSGLFAYFKSLANGINSYMQQAFNNSTESAKQFAKDGISVVNILIKGFAQLAKVIAGVFNAIKIAYAGYLKLTGFIGRGLREDNIVKLKEDLHNLKDVLDTKDFGVFTNQNASIVKAKMRAIEAQINAQKGLDGKFSNLQEKGQKLISDAAKSQINLNKMADNISKISANAATGISGKIKEIKSIDESIAKQKTVAKTALEKLGAGYGNLSLQAKKAGKTASKAHSSAAKAAKAHTKELNKQNNAAKKLQDTYKNIFSGGVDSIFSGNFKDGIGSMLDNIKNSLLKPLKDSISSYLGNTFRGLTSGLGPLMGGISGLGIGMLGSAIIGLTTSTVSASELAASKGQSLQELNDSSFVDMKQTLEKYMQPQLTTSKSMLDHIKSVDSNLLKAVGGMDGFFSGSNYQPKSDNGVFGLFASTKELVGAGLEFARQSVNSLTSNPLARGYQAEKVTSSGIFGLFGGTSIDNSYKSIKSRTQKALGRAFKAGLDGVEDATTKLGFDSEVINKKLQQAVVNLGKIDFKDLKPEEQAQALNKAFSGALSGALEGAIGSSASPQIRQQLDSYAMAGEQYVGTVMRVANDLDIVQRQLMLFGQSVTTFAQSEELVKAAGGLETFKNGMDSFVKGFFSGAEQKQFLQQQLNYALAVYGKALPASKAQFKSLVLETQQKILTVKASIATMKAEIAARVASGKMSLAAAYGELEAKGSIAQAQRNVINYQIGANNAFIHSANQAGRASVGFGENIHKTIEAMATGAADAVQQGAAQAVDSAGNIDYSRITSPAIAAAQAQLKNLDGLYGSLMSNMSSFSSYYNDAASMVATSTDKVATSTNKAIEALDSLHKRLLGIAELKAEWTGNKVEAARITLEATERYTKLFGLTYDNFLSKFEQATKKKGFSDKDLDKWKQMSSAVKSLHSALGDSAKEIKDITKGLLDFNSHSVQSSVALLGKYANNKEYAKSEFNAAISRLKGQNDLTYKQRVFAYSDFVSAYKDNLKNEDNGKKQVDLLEKIDERLKKLEEIEYNTYKIYTGNEDKEVAV